MYDTLKEKKFKTKKIVKKTLTKKEALNL